MALIEDDQPEPVVDPGWILMNGNAVQNSQNDRTIMHSKLGTLNDPDTLLWNGGMLSNTFLPLLKKLGGGDYHESGKPMGAQCSMKCQHRLPTTAPQLQDLIPREKEGLHDLGGLRGTEAHPGTDAWVDPPTGWTKVPQPWLLDPRNLVVPWYDEFVFFLRKEGNHDRRIGLAVSLTEREFPSELGRIDQLNRNPPHGVKSL